MKFRAEDTVSERQLVLALAEGGRSVSLNQLSAWRKDGLLPPLASTGVGSGRAYYWREPDILEQAETVHDGLNHHGRADLVTVTLWLRGFSVALPKFRRAWLACTKARKAPAIRRPPPGQGMTPAAADDLGQLLLQAMLGAAAAVQPGDKSRPALAMLATAAVRLDIAAGERAARQFWQMAQMMTAVLAASDIIREASDAEMTRAQTLLCGALKFVAESCDGETMATVADALGETLFLFILTLLRSGQEAVLEAGAARIAAATRQPRVAPQPVYAQA